MKSARKLKAAIEGAPKGHRPEPITDEFAQAVARKLESRGIVCVPGLPADEPQWFDLAIANLSRQQELAAEREARRKAEEEAQNTPQTTSSILMGEIAKAATGSGSATIPLNVLWSGLRSTARVGPSTAVARDTAEGRHACLQCRWNPLTFL
jgi:hypothetical protein